MAPEHPDWQSTLRPVPSARLAKNASRVERVFSGYGGRPSAAGSPSANGEAGLVRASEAVRVAARIRPHTAEDEAQVPNVRLSHAFTCLRFMSRIIALSARGLYTFHAHENMCIVVHRSGAQPAVLVMLMCAP